ncbi:hypothetical protein HYS91_02070 [Candidatus Daviesbacteria bacterium]|nr:hypothetical protein [Candidatus Daviesbacteria bacterium]
MDEFRKLSPLAESLITYLEKKEVVIDEERISVNPVVSEVAHWYEKLRNALDYGEDEVILRLAIERILKRRLLLGGSGINIAEPLVRELVWARYFPDSSVPESIIKKVAEKIDLYLHLEKKVLIHHKIDRNKLHQWILQLMSVDISYLLNPNKEEEMLSSFMYQILKDKVRIEDDTEEVRDTQVFIAIRRTFNKSDVAYIRYHLFNQFFDKLNHKNLEKIAVHFPKGQKKIDSDLNYSLKDRFYTFVKSQTAPFLVLEDIFRKHRGRLKELVLDSDNFSLLVLRTCNNKYQDIFKRIRRSIIRSVIFLLFTKAIFALTIEGAFEKYLYGRVLWNTLALNTFIPPVLMVVVSFFIRIPDKENSMRILEKINAVLYTPEKFIKTPLSLRKHSKVNLLMSTIFTILWFAAFVLGFGTIIFVLRMFHFNIISQAVFLFFIAIVSFLAYRINQIGSMFITGEEKQNVLSIFLDFFFVPFIQIGRHLTLGISQLNVFLLFFDIFIETPFKALFSFFEQWFLFLRTQREKLD